MVVEGAIDLVCVHREQDSGEVTGVASANVMNTLTLVGSAIGYR
jgi:hypothetical protein